MNRFTNQTVISSLEILKLSLQEEFIHHAASWMPSILKAKKRQIKHVDYIIKLYQLEKYKLEAYTICMGSSFTQLSLFVQRPEKDIDIDLKFWRAEMFEEPVKEIRYATKPIGVPKGWKSEMIVIKDLI
jgi:hypothetical protein